MDRDKQNNRPENLEFATRGRNQRHAATFGVRSKLTPDQAREVRRRYQSGERPSALGREFGVRRQTIWAVGTYRAWTDLDLLPSDIDATIQRVLL